MNKYISLINLVVQRSLRVVGRVPPLWKHDGLSPALLAALPVEGEGGRADQPVDGVDVGVVIGEGLEDADANGGERSI